MPVSQQSSRLSSIARSKVMQVARAALDVASVVPAASRRPSLAATRRPVPRSAQRADPGRPDEHVLLDQRLEHEPVERDQRRRRRPSGRTARARSADRALRDRVALEVVGRARVGVARRWSPGSAGRSPADGPAGARAGARTQRSMIVPIVLRSSDRDPGRGGCAAARDEVDDRQPVDGHAERALDDDRRRAAGDDQDRLPALALDLERARRRRSRTGSSRR